ncbi:MAG: hypothetical protein VX265_04435 [Myxococcota bacterium]|nr:hypothetical protein [Myxococcota bacterium]
MTTPDAAETPNPRAWTLVWAALGVLVCLGIALGPLEGIPHVQDEVVYQLQSRIFSEFKLWDPERLPRALYHYDFVTNADGRRYGVFPVGWPMVLAVGTLLGLPWLVNPLLHGLGVVLGTRLTARLAGPDAGWLVAPLLALSPALVWQGASRMAHALTLVLSLAAMVLVAGPPSRRRALAAGACVAGLLLTRPMDGVVIGTILGGWALVRGVARDWLLVVPGVAVGVGALLVVNLVYEGDPFLFPQHAWFARGEPSFNSPGFRFDAACNALGFGSDRGCAATFGSLGHTPGKGILAASLNAKLAGTAWFGLPGVALLGLGAVRDGRARRLLVLGLTTWVGLAGAYALYWYGGVCLGPRFHHGAAPLMLGAVAAGASWLIRRFGLPRVAGLLLLIPLGTTLARSLAELPGHWGVDDRLSELEARWTDGPALMLVAYGPAYRTAANLPVTTDDGIGQYSAIQRRGMWMERRDGPLVYAEYQPALVDAARARHPGLPAHVLILTSEAARDRIVPLPDRTTPQVDDLPLPLAPIPVPDGEEPPG